MARPRMSRLFVVVLPFLAGCGSSKMAPVHVKVTYQGKPVTAGSVLFMPEGGEDRPATGELDENGELQLTTNAKNDGALIGRHVVVYRAPPLPQNPNSEGAKKVIDAFKQFGKCTLPPKHMVEVKPGKNEVTLELILDKSRETRVDPGPG